MNGVGSFPAQFPNPISIVDRNGTHVHFQLENVWVNISKYPCEVFGSPIDWILMKYDNGVTNDYCDRRTQMKCGDILYYTVPCNSGVAKVHLWLNEFRIFQQKPKVPLYPPCEPVGAPRCNPYGWCNFEYALQCDPCGYYPDRKLMTSKEENVKSFADVEPNQPSLSKMNGRKNDALLLANEKKLEDCLDDNVREIVVDKCGIARDEKPIEIISMDGETVTFNVNQVWKECSQSSTDQGWIAVDYVGLSNDLVCVHSGGLGCGTLSSHTTRCKEGLAVVDLYVGDGSDGMFVQSDGVHVAVPDACNVSGDSRDNCHFRYLLSCHTGCVGDNESLKAGNRLPSSLRAQK